VNFKDTQALALKAVDFSTSREVEKFLQEELRRFLKDDYERICMA